MLRPVPVVGLTSDSVVRQMVLLAVTAYGFGNTAKGPWVFVTVPDVPSPQSKSHQVPQSFLLSLRSRKQSVSSIFITSKGHKLSTRTHTSVFIYISNIHSPV